MHVLSAADDTTVFLCTVVAAVAVHVYLLLVVGLVSMHSALSYALRGAC